MLIQLTMITLIGHICCVRVCISSFLPKFVQLRIQAFMIGLLVCLILMRVSTAVWHRQVNSIIKFRSGEQWRCSFRKNHCGIFNQSNMPTNFTWLPRAELFEEQGLFYLDLSSCKHNGARLVTPYFSWNNHLRSVCLTIKYIIFGNAITRLLVVKQDKVNVAIWSDKFSVTGRWNKAHIKVNVFSGKPARFFFEVNFNNQPNRLGFFAISEIILRDSFCPR